MAIWFDLETVSDLSIFDSAPIRFEYTMHLSASADEVWAGLVADKPLAWCKALNGKYTSERPFAEGTTREVSANFKTIQLKERFFLWDEAKRCHAFYVEKANAPAFRQFAEYYQVTPTKEGCEFIWKFAMVGRTGLGLPLKLITPVAKLALFDSFIRDTERHFGTVR